MEKIKIRVLKSEDAGIFHDSRGDVKKLAKMVNLLCDKVNELIEEVEFLKIKNNLKV